MGKFNQGEGVPVILQRHHVQVSGLPGASETLLFLHGFGSDQTIWSRLVPAFAPHYRTVTMDHLGAGRSDPDHMRVEKGRYWHLRAYAQDVLSVIHALELTDVTVIGHAAGGIIGLLACNEEPWRFRRLAMINASPRYVEEADYQGGFSRSALGDVHLAMLSAGAGWQRSFAAQSPSFADSPQSLHAFATSLQAIPREFALHALVALMTGDYREDLEMLSVPALILHARRDPLVPDSVAEYMHRRLMGSRLQWLEAAGPWPPVSAAEAICQALAEFGLRSADAANEFPGFPENVCWGAAPGSW